MKTTVEFMEGPAGALEVLVDAPASAPRGLAVVTHPHPQQGGDATHKVPHLLARTLRDAGWLALRPNFRGVGGSAGQHDEGEGETEDVLAICAMLRECHPGLPLLLAGFSFGAFVQAKAAHALQQSSDPPWRCFLAGMPFGDVHAGRSYDTPRGLRETTVVHGELDERVALAAIFEWARPDTQPVIVVPGADHFFTGRLPALRALLARQVSGLPRSS